LLESTSDAIAASVSTIGFVPPSTIVLHLKNYDYNKNGAFTYNFYRGISSIQYNVLNLPEKIRFGAEHSIQYGYDATGVKRKVIHTTLEYRMAIKLPSESGDPIRKQLVASQVKDTTDYCGPIVYENGVLKYILTPEGYIMKNGNATLYNYYLKDHLGNNRIVLEMDESTSKVVQATDYYPFGMPHTNNGKNPERQPYKFGGKEYDEMHGLNWYDFEARQYYGIVPGFTTMDPLAEKYYAVSPYAYCKNNPVNYIDPTGMDWYEANGTITWTDYTSQKDLDDNNITGRYLGQAHVVFNGSRDELLGTKQAGDRGYDGKHTNGYIDGAGAVTASVTLYGSNGADDITSMTGFTMTSDVEQYGAIAEGLYNANYDATGKSGALKSNWVLNNRGAVPTMDNEPNLSPYAAYNYGKPVKDGIFIHSTNASGYAGGNISTGCLLLAPQDFKTFNSVMSGVSNFTVQVTRQQTVNLPLHGVTGVVPNVFIPQTIIKR
jgi:RHS repeat-associated protein